MLFAFFEGHPKREGNASFKIFTKNSFRLTKKVDAGIIEQFILVSLP